MVILLDNGHGGLKNGVYTTCPSPTNDPKTWVKMWKHSTFTIYEGDFNRKLVQRIAQLASIEGIETHILVPEVEDIPLRERVIRANEFYTKRKDAWLLSIHGNAANTSAKGFEVFTTKGETASDPIAEVIATTFGETYKNKCMRWDLTDGDKDKESNFYVLKNTWCPAVLTENFFFDNLEDAKFMNSEEGLNSMARTYIEAFKRLPQWKKNTTTQKQ